MQYDVFISYSSIDQKIAEGVCAYLEQHGIRCFVAYRDIPRGVVWSAAIVKALEHSRVMLVIFSKHFNASSQVDREIELAAEQAMPILTFRLSDDDFTGAKKYYLKNLNWIDAFSSPERYFNSLKDNVVALLGDDTCQSPQLESQFVLQGNSTSDSMSNSKPILNPSNRKIWLVLICCIVGLFAISFFVSFSVDTKMTTLQNSGLQFSSLSQRNLKKEYKKKIKDFRKDGWTIYGTSHSLEVALLKHYEKISSNENVYEIVGIATAFYSKNVGKQIAMNNACIAYAQQASCDVKGSLISHIGNDELVDDDFYAIFETIVEKEIKGELFESFSIIREAGINEKTGKTVYEMQVFFLVDEEAAFAARMRALDNAMRESSFEQKCSEVKERFTREGK